MGLVTTPGMAVAAGALVAAGAEVMMPMMDAFWGDRFGKVKDPFGHAWYIATHTEDLSDEEIDRRAAEWFSSQAR